MSKKLNVEQMEKMINTAVLKLIKDHAQKVSHMLKVELVEGVR